MKEMSFQAALWSTDPNTDYEEGAVAGQLSFDGASYLRLDIPVGILLDYPSIPTEHGYMKRHTVDGLHADYIYGFSQTGDYYLLRDVTSPGVSFAIPGLEKQSLQAASLFITKQKITEDPIIGTISFKIPGLREWIGTAPFKATTTFDSKGRPREFSFNCNVQECEYITLHESDELTIYVSFTFPKMGGTISSYEFCFESDCTLHIKYKQW